MLQRTLAALAGTLLCLAATAQANVNIGAGTPLSLPKLATYTTFATGNDRYFVWRTIEDQLPKFTVLTLDEQGNTRISGSVRQPVGTFTNSFEVHSVLGVGSHLVALIENRDKGAGLNRLSLRPIDGVGAFTGPEQPIGALEYKKMMQSGRWFTAVSPDGKHLAVVGQMPYEKDSPNRYKFFVIDDKLSLSASGELSFPDDTKKQSFSDFYTSDKGDFYLVSAVQEKGYTYPQIYKSSVAAPKGTVQSVQFADPSDRLLSYTCAVNAAGDLVVAGYGQKKRTVSFDTEAASAFWYSTAGQKLVAHPFARPVKNLRALGLAQNGKVQFLVGEQYKAERVPGTPQQNLNFEENYNYQHDDLQVSAFSDEGEFAFEVSLPRSWRGYNADADLVPAWGILHGKLTLVYNDQYGKYVPRTSYDNAKLPVLVSITNDGLMEQPLHLEKEFKVPTSYTTLYPFYFLPTPSELLLLQTRGSEVEGVVFR